jgi:hypothetical protein
MIDKLIYTAYWKQIDKKMDLFFEIDKMEPSG